MARGRRPGQIDDAPNASALTYLYSRLPFLIQRVDQVASALFALEAGSLQITLPQFQFLDLLKTGGPASQVDIARHAGTDTSTTSLVLGNLTKRHLARRSTDERDRRRKIVEITIQGLVVHADASAAYRRMQRRLFLALGGKGDALVDALRRIAVHGKGAPPWQPFVAESPAVTGCTAPVLDSLAFLVRRALQQAQASMIDGIGAHDLTMRQYATLLIVCFHEGIGESGIGRTLGYEATNAAFVVKLLLAKGLIEAESAHPGGRRRYRATNSGKGMLLTVEPGLTQGEAALAAALSSAQITELQRMLGMIIRSFDGMMRFPLVYFAAMTAEPRWPVPLQPHLVVDLAMAPL